jgi:acyl-CoA reductase-like NAD-dependent aldehyde dehydrogenase
MTAVADLKLYTAVGGWRSVPGCPGSIARPIRQRSYPPSRGPAEAALASEAIDAAAAHANWRALGAIARGEVLRTTADILEACSDEIGRELSRKEGKAIGEGVKETQLISIFRYYAAKMLEPVRASPAIIDGRHVPRLSLHPRRGVWSWRDVLSSPRRSA